MIHQPNSGLWRVPLVRACRLERKGNAVDALLCNISVDGLYVAFEPVPAAGERLRLSFTLPNDDEPIDVEAEVCWRNSSQTHKVQDLPTGCGVQFVAIERPARQRIEELVRAYREPGPHRPEWL
jgi:uncharacterized protein (TIGR02266 family)